MDYIKGKMNTFAEYYLMQIEKDGKPANEELHAMDCDVNPLLIRNQLDWLSSS